ALADHGRQKDMYKLAQMGNKQCIRMWNDFASDCPEIARLVVADVAADRQTANKAAALVDEVLAGAERWTGGQPAASNPADDAARELLASPDPAEREAAWAHLYGSRR